MNSITAPIPLVLRLPLGPGAHIVALLEDPSAPVAVVQLRDDYHGDARVVPAELRAMTDQWLATWLLTPQGDSGSLYGLAGGVDPVFWAETMGERLLSLEREASVRFAA